MSLLEVERLSAFYGRTQILHDVTFAVEAGDLVSLIGPNGAGKTTLLRALSRLVDIAGRITFDGEDLSGLTPQDVVRRRMVQCAEGRQLFPDMSAEDNLELGAFTRTRPAEIQADLDRVYALFPVLQERRRQRAGTMSGGEQQMLAIGRALMARPKIILLDEPSFGIAPKVVDRIFTVLRELNAEGLTALVVEQNVSVALENSRHGYVLEGGRIVLQGPSAELMRNEVIRETYLGM